MNHISDEIEYSETGYYECRAYSRSEWFEVSLSNAFGGGLGWGAATEDLAQAILRREMAKPENAELEPHIFRIEEWHRYHRVEVKP